MTVTEMAFQNIVGKGENTDNQHFPLSNIFNPLTDMSLNWTTFVSTKCFQCNKSKILLSGDSLSE